MTDDTDTAEREETERAGSLPLIETFAALEAELVAREERIERLERELTAVSNDADGERKETTDPASESDTVEDSEPRSHEDWVPETDPLADTGTPNASAEQPGVTPETEATSEGVSGTAAATDDSGLKPVRTASSRQPASARDDDATDGSTTDRDEFGLTMESTTDLTGGSLGSSTDESFPTTTAEATSTEGPSGSTGFDTAGVNGDDAQGVGADEVDAEGVEAEEVDIEAVVAEAVESADVDAEEVDTEAVVAEAVESVDVDAEEVDTKDVDGESSEDGGMPPDPTADRGERLSRLVRRAELLNDEEVVEAFVRGIESLDDVTREMLAHYREVDDAEPVDAHVAAGGSGERQYAYARNRTLRQAGVVEHHSGGRYRYALPDLVAEALDRSADQETLADAVAIIESETGIDE